MGDEKIYGVERIASVAGVSIRTVYRWLHLPEGVFFETASISNTGGGLGWATATMLSSLQHFHDVILTERTRRLRIKAANMRWGKVTAVNSCQSW